MSVLVSGPHIPGDANDDEDDDVVDDGVEACADDNAVTKFTFLTMLI